MMTILWLWRTGNLIGVRHMVTGLSPRHRGSRVGKFLRSPSRDPSGHAEVGWLAPGGTCCPHASRRSWADGVSTWSDQVRSVSVRLRIDTSQIGPVSGGVGKYSTATVVLWITFRNVGTTAMERVMARSGHGGMLCRKTASCRGCGM